MSRQRTHTPYGVCQKQENIMKKILLATLVALTLTGCATNQQTGTLAGAAVGAATGKVLGGQSGAVIGSVLGAAAGSNVGASMDAQAGQSPQVIQAVPNEIFYTPPPRVIYVNPWYAAPGPYWRWSYHNRYGWGWYHPHRHHFHHRHGR